MTRTFGLISGLFARGGGYATLVERFETSAAPAAPVFRNQTVMMDNTVAYRFCVAFAPGPAGLYMRIEARGMKRHPAVLIPWEQIVHVEKARLYWFSGVRLTVGEPRITQLIVYARLFESFRPYL